MLKSVIRRLLPARINRVYLRTVFCTAYYRIHNKVLLQKKRRKDVWNVAFIVMSHTMWKEDGLYSLFASDDKFHPFLILAPSCRIYIDGEGNGNAYCAELQQMKVFFSDRGCEFLTYDEFCESSIDVDVAFYQQPYEDGCLPLIKPLRLRNTLLCYIPYSIPTLFLRYDYEHLLMNIAWKLFYPTESCKRMVKELSINKHNVEVSGYPSADRLLDAGAQTVNYWHTDKKHIVWAPHHSLSEENKNIHQSTFLSYSEYMLSLAERYAEEIEVAFNPHPLLFESLKTKQGWTNDDIEHYMLRWQKLGIVTLDNYVDVFKTSDALIHDCASFMCEYMYTGKPALFLCRNSIAAHRRRLGELACNAFDAHYKAECADDIERFISDVVLHGNDNKKREREDVFCELIPPHGKTASANIYESIRKSLCLCH